MPGYDQASVLHAAGRRAGLGWTGWVLAACVLAGLIAFFFGIGGDMAQRAWQAYLINLVYWTGLASGAVMFSAVLILTKATWGRTIKRLAESPLFFLPVAFFLFGIVYIGRDHLFPWLHEPLPEKSAWLNLGFFFLREAAALLLLAVTAIFMVFHGIRADRRMLAKSPDRYDADAAGNGHARAQMIWANFYGIFFGVLLTLIAFDLIMSLNPHWYSTLFGAYYFVGSFFTGIATLIIICFIAKRRLGLQDYIKPLHLHNLGKLLLGFCLLTADFFYAQFFIMWYGNLPEETRFVLARVRESPWEPVAWTVLLVCFALPFVILLSRRIKMKHGFMVVLCSVILAGMWLERFLLIAPSIWPGRDLPLGPLEILITIGFFGIVGLCVWVFLHRYPLMPVADPLFWKGLKRVR